MEQRPMATNQGESSSKDNEVKKPYLMDKPGNLEGNESGESPENEWGATTGEKTPASQKDEGINISASTENLSAKFKYPNKSQEQGAGSGQYQ